VNGDFLAEGALEGDPSSDEGSEAHTECSWSTDAYSSSSTTGGVAADGGALGAQMAAGLFVASRCLRWSAFKFEARKLT
jgi:hypothetical protein